MADLCADEALVYGVTRELASAPENYEGASDWAWALYRDGFEALLYLPRFSLGTAYAVALFGPAGAPDDGTVISTRPLADVLDEIGYAELISPIPSSAGATVDDTAEPESV